MVREKSPALTFVLLMVAVFVGVAPHAFAQAADQAENTLQGMTLSAQQQLADSLNALAALRKQIADEKVPLGRKLRALEDELIAVRRDYQDTTRQLDKRNLDLNVLRNEIKARHEEKTYLGSQISQYLRNFESRLHIAEFYRYHTAIEAATLAAENSTLSDIDVFQTQASLIETSVERLHETLNGVQFDGQAVDATGLVKEGTFVLIGPAALFGSADGQSVGTAELRFGSSQPTVIPFASEEITQAAAETVASGRGAFPLDPTLGNAHKIEATQQSFLEHISKAVRFYLEPL